MEKKTKSKKSSKKSAKKAPKAAKSKAAAPKEKKERGLGKVAIKVLKTLATSKTKLFPESDPGELSYGAIAKEAKVAINNLTSVISKESKGGKKYPRSLESLGYVTSQQVETTNAAGEAKDTPFLFSITTKGREYLKTL